MAREIVFIAPRLGEPRAAQVHGVLQHVRHAGDVVAIVKVAALHVCRGGGERGGRVVDGDAAHAVVKAFVFGLCLKGRGFEEGFLTRSTQQRNAGCSAIDEETHTNGRHVRASPLGVWTIIAAAAPRLPAACRAADP